MVRFVKINNRILDYGVHRKESSIAKKDIIFYIAELLSAYGFEQKDGCCFENKGLNLKLELCFSRCEKEVFV